MSNTNNNNMQTQTLSALHNAIMEGGGKDRPPMLASETAFSKSVKESSLDSGTKYILSKEDLKGTRIEYGFKRTHESKVDLGKALDVGLVVMESSGTKSEVQDTSSRLGNDTDTDDADIRPIYDEEPMVDV
ncbi:hypothetical protein Tco_1126273 [Tanacetum coccineum]